MLLKMFLKMDMAAPRLPTEVAGCRGALCEGAGSNTPIPRGQAGWQTLALLANHILSGSHPVLGDGLLELCA